MSLCKETPGREQRSNTQMPSKVRFNGLGKFCLLSYSTWYVCWASEEGLQANPKHAAGNELRPNPSFGAPPAATGKNVTIQLQEASGRKACISHKCTSSPAGRDVDIKQHLDPPPPSQVESDQQPKPPHARESTRQPADATTG